MAFDVDDTIIMWEGSSYTLNELHLDEMRRAKIRGQFVIMWSKSPVSFIETVIRENQLENLVDLVMQKPNFYFDDRKADEWMVHCYKGENPRASET